MCSLGCVVVWYHFLGLLSVSRLGPDVSFSAGTLSCFFVASTLVVDDTGWLRRCRSQRFNFLVSIRTLDDIFDFLSTFPVLRAVLEMLGDGYASVVFHLHSLCAKRTEFAAA